MRMAKIKNRNSADVLQAKLIKDREGRTLVDDGDIRKRWGEYFAVLLNMENERMERSVESISDAHIEPIAREEVVQALSKMKRGKAVGPDGIPAEAWKCLGKIGIDFLMSLFNDIVHSNTMPKEWRRSILVPIYKGKGDVQDCGNYRGKSLPPTMKIWEREKRLKKMVNFGEEQYGFMPGKSAADAIFALKQLRTSAPFTVFL